MAATVGELNIKLNMELARLESQIKQATSKIDRAGGSWHGSIGKAAKAINGTLATIGVGASISGLIAFGKQCLDLGGNIVDLSSQAGLATDAFQALRLAAMENGSTGEEVAAAFAKMNRSMQDAIEGGKSQAEAFEKLNLSAAYLKTLAPETRFELIARAVIGAKDSQEAYNAAADIFGAKIGPKLNQLLTAMATQGYEKIAEGNKKMTLTPEQLKTLDDAGDKLARIWELTKLQGAKGIVAAASVVDPAQVDILNQQIENLERLKAAGKITVAWNSRDDIVNVGDKLAQLTAARDRLAGKSPVALSNNQDTINAEAMAQSMAAIDRFNASEVEYAKERAKADKESERVNERLAKLGEAQAKAELDALEPIERIGLLKAEQKEIDATIATVSAGTEAGVERLCELEERRLDIKKELATLKPEVDKKVDAELSAFFGDLDAKSAANVKAINREMREMERLADGIGDAFGDAFERAILDGQKVGDMLKSLGRDILALVVRQSITSPIAGLISGGISSMFGGIMGGAATSGVVTGTVNGNFGGLRASGGPVSPNEWYMTGEKGPEPFIPSTAGTIVSNSDLVSAMGMDGGGGTSITVVQNFAAGVSQSQLAEAMRQTREAAKSGVMDAIQRRGNGFGMVAA